MAESSPSLMGVGVYSVPEAARLTRVSTGRIRRWIRGYSYRVKGGLRASAPVWAKQISDGDDDLALTFRDLLEIRFIDAFLKRGITWKVIRLSSERAAELYQTTHPFATRRFKTDGQRIFAEIMQETGERSLLDLVKSQYAFRQVIDPFLMDVELSAQGEALRWWPLTRKGRVVIDPQRSFGRPVVLPESVPTEILARAFRAEQSIEAVANWYMVDQRSVQAAVEFEEQLAA